MVTTMSAHISDLGVCSCGKVRFASKADAEQIRAAKGWHTAVAYQCSGFWHLGRRGWKSKKANLSRRARR